MSSDKIITGFVLARLDVSPFLEGAKVEAETTGGVVTLSGTVLDARQKMEAEEIARTSDPDVKSVVNKLEIKPPVFDSLMAIQVASSHNIGLMPAVKEALLQHPWLDVTGVYVAAAKGREGIFHLTGTVPDAEHKEEAEKAVQAVPGIKYVINELEIGAVTAPGNIVPDRESKADPKACRSLMEKYAVDSRNLIIINDIKTALLQHPVLDATDISVRLATGCEVGIYKLEGTVPSEKHKGIAGEVATAVKGVQYIDNQLTVK